MEIEKEINKLQQACDIVFGKRIVITPRATAAFTDTYCTLSLFNNYEVHLTSDFDCFLGVVANSPACAEILASKNINMEELLDQKRPREKNTELFEPNKQLSFIDYREILDDLFSQKFPFEQGLTVTGENIRSSGTITELDIFIGALEASRNRLVPNNTGRNLLIASRIPKHDRDEMGDDYLRSIELATSSIFDLDVSHSNQQFVIYLDEVGKLRLRPFGASVLGSLQEKISQNEPFIFRGNVLQPLTSARMYSSDIIGEFEEMLNSFQCSEKDFQKFFERYPHLLTSLDFKKAHPQPILYKDEGGKLIPDFFLEKIDSGWDAILDLKTPYNNMVIKRENRVYFAQWIHETIAQLQYYREWFEDAEHRNQIEHALTLGTRVFRPKMVMVAGRSHHFSDDVERMRLLSNQIMEVELWTYDDVLNRAKRFNELFR